MLTSMKVKANSKYSALRGTTEKLAIEYSNSEMVKCSVATEEKLKCSETVSSYRAEIG